MNGSCEHCRGLLWDLVWDLLEPDQAADVRAHLAACSACLGELKTAEEQQARIARVARRDVVVPLFVRPEEPAAPRPVVLPFYRRVRTAALGAAAAVLLAVGMPYWFLDARSRSLTDAVEEAATRFAAATAERQQAYQTSDQAQELLAQEKIDQQLRMQLVGPVAYRPGLGSTHQVVLTDLQGRPADAEVTARILDAENRELFRFSQQTRQGTLVVALPPNLPLHDQTPRIEWTAARAEARTSLLEPLPVHQAELVSHLAVAKSLYQPGDVIFFRSVTLDRFSRTPATRPEPVEFTLTDPEGQVLHIARGMLAEGGIAGGAIELPRTALKEGRYKLTVSDSRGQFAPQTRTLQVRGDRPVKLRKSLEFDRPFYRPGDKVTATIKAARLSNGEPVARQRVFGHLKADGKPVPVKIQGQTDNQGVATVTVQLPAQLGGSVRLSVVINEPGNAEALEREVPLEAPGVAVEFFPEGGDLIAGLVNRVYFRTRTPGGHLVAVQGIVLDSQRREVARVQTSPADTVHGLGFFRFTPEAGEQYTFQAAGVEPHPLPAVQPQGVLLHVPTAVLGAGQEAPVSVQTSGTPRTVLVAAFCRGHLVAYEALPGLSGRRDLLLALPPELSGVLRVTAFEDAEELRPVAERLVYRAPAARLNLAVTTPDQPGKPGEPVRLTFRSTDEEGKPLDAWLLATVVDQEAAGLSVPPRHRSLAAHFQLLVDLRRPEELEDADFLVSNHPKAAETLDLFLGTQGWRRFRDLAEATPGEPAAAALVKLDSQASALRAVATELSEWRQQAGERDRELYGQQEQAYAAARFGSTAVHEFRVVAEQFTWWATGAAVLFILLLTLIPVVYKLPRLPWLVAAAGAALTALLFFTVLPRAVDHAAPEITWGALPRNPRTLATPAVLAATQPAAARQVASLPTSGGSATAFRENLVQLEQQVERRSLAHGTAGKPIRSSTPGVQIARPVSLDTRKPDKVKVMTPPSPLPSEAREYAYLPPTTPAAELPDTVLWHPALRTVNGQTEVTVTLPRAGATYRLLLQGHDAAGRFGTIHAELRTR